MDGKEVKLTIVEFFAFGIKSQRVYINKDKDFIKEELNTICNTNQLISITTYSATELETQKFNGETDGVPEQS
ncbi:MAG: hypothetical protein IPJ01_11440 [Micavibrio sp.]|nr:hypothetical protein [Micavibrio sp.]